MKFTPEQYNAVKRDGNTAVFACPGAGKTRVIAGKVIRLLTDPASDPRKIACITFTNGALEEIERRLSSAIGAEFADQYTAATIHSFLLNQVVIPYCAAVPEIPTPVKIATPDSEIYYEAAHDVFGERLNERILKSLSQCRRLKDGSPSHARLISEAEVIAFWSRLHNAGYMDYSAILYYAHEIMVHHRHLARVVASRYAWLVIDEYQDCSDIVLDCLKLIHDVGSSKFFIVGDYDQAIYSFNGVTIAALDGFLDSINANRITLSGSHRLPERVVDVANAILTKEPPVRSEREPPTVGAVAVRRTETAVRAITSIFIPTLLKRGIPLQRSAIISSKGDTLLSIYTSLVQLGYAAILCGTRIYRRGSISTFLETIAAHVLHRSAETFRYAVSAVSAVLLEAQLYLRNTSLNSADVFVTEAVKAFEPLIRNSQGEIRALDVDLIFSATAGLFTSLCISLDGFTLFLNSLTKTAASFEEIPESYWLTWDMLAEHASTHHSISLTTIHGSKGLEYDAVAVVSINQDTLPFFAADDLEEERRKLYVAATRSSNVLLLSSDASDGKPESIFLRPLRHVVSQWGDERQT
jgi:DNA helicase-2/ATP-dependent DNA helicase PcrA